MSKFARICLIVIMLAAVFPAALSASASENTATIGLSLPNMNNPFFEGLNNGAHDAAYEAGAELMVVLAEDSIETELANIEALIDQGVSAILFRPVDPVLSVPAFELASEADVPVVLIGALELDEEADRHAASQITGSDAEGGEIAAAALCDAVAGTGTVLELVGAPETADAARGASFEAAMAETCPDVALVPFETADLEGDALTEALVEAFRAQKVAGVFGYNGAITVVALEASFAARQRSVIFVGFDATEQSIAAVQGGRLRAVITPYSADLGRVGVETSLALINGEEVEALIEVTMTVLDNSTIDSFRPRCQNPRGCG